jgi:hypothetical protein
MTETGDTTLREDFEAEKSRYDRNILRAGQDAAIVRAAPVSESAGRSPQITVIIRAQNL